MIQPASRDNYNRAGVTSLMKLTPASRHLVSWEKDTFVLNQKALAEDCERFKTYAETPEALTELEYWENLASTLNKHLDRKSVSAESNAKAGERKFFDTGDVYQFARKLGLKERGGRFIVDSENLARVIKNMNLVPVC